jgi:hypothetical protein
VHTPTARQISTGCLSRPAAQLHSRQGELRLLHAAVEQETPAGRGSELYRDRELLSSVTRGVNNESTDFGIAHALRGGGRRNFNDAEVRKAVRRLRMSNASVHVSPSSSFALHSAPATALSSIVGVQFAFFPWKYLLLIAPPSLYAWQCIPEDPPPQKACRSARSRRSWACVVSCTCLCTCSLRRTHGVQMTNLVLDPTLWHATASRSHRLRPSLPIRHLDAWKLIYKSLYHCERNLGYAFPQSVQLLSEHTNFSLRMFIKGASVSPG